MMPNPPVQLALSHLGKDGGTGGNLAVVGATPARLVLGGAKDVDQFTIHIQLDTWHHLTSMTSKHQHDTVYRCFQK